MPFLLSLFQSTATYRCAADTPRLLCRTFTPKRHRQLRAKDLPKVLTWRLERDSNQRPFGVESTNANEPPRPSTISDIVLLSECRLCSRAHDHAREPRRFNFPPEYKFVLKFRPHL